MQSPNTLINQAIPGWDLDALNETFATATPETIVRWAVAQGVQILTSTSFGPHAAATLHLVQRLDPGSLVVWVDSGFVDESTRHFARNLSQQLCLEPAIFRPKTTPLTCLVQLGIKDLDQVSSAQRRHLADTIKLEPFQRALDRFSPQIWISGIRGEETAFRSGLDIASWDERGILKLAPFLRASSSDMESYLSRHELPLGPPVFDPTKAAPHLECGLHTRTNLHRPRGL